MLAGTMRVGIFAVVAVLACESAPTRLPVDVDGGSGAAGASGGPPATGGAPAATGGDGGAAAGGAGGSGAIAGEGGAGALGGSSGSGALGDSGGSAVCVGTPVPCSDLAVEHCERARGCRTSASGCEGAVVACSLLAESVCETQPGCSLGTGGGDGGVAGAGGAAGSSGAAGAAGSGGAGGIGGNAGAAGEAGASGGGGGGASGSGGTGGSDCASESSCCAGQSHSEPLIDDLADGDNAIAAPRRGWWSAYNDSADGGNTAQVPPPDPTGITPFAPTASGADFAACTSGTHGSLVDYPYAGIGFNLNPSSTGDCTYDASRFTGIRFRARGDVKLWVKFPSLATQPVDEGGTCQDSCYDDFGYVITVTPDWAEHTVPFSTAMQEGWGASAGPSLDASELLRIQFRTADALPGTGFEFCIDDVTFY